MSIILNDSRGWVQAQVSKTLQGHIEAGSFEVGHIVEVASSLGSPRDLHIVSCFICNHHDHYQFNHQNYHDYHFQYCHCRLRWSANGVYSLRTVLRLATWCLVLQQMSRKVRL